MTVAAASRATAAKAQIIKRFMGTSVPLPMTGTVPRRIQSPWYAVTSRPRSFGTLWQGNKDTLYRVHGTNEPWKIGSNVSSGCIRMINDDVIDLYDRVGISTKMVVLASNVG